ncbi:ATP-binding protein [Candidatus Micrarchaeota archaeon]|nr:ATP-binding protein [Candidatus Micrarchaeota archaeon]
MDKRLGTIISREDSPSTFEFFFVIKNQEAKKGQYVQVKDKEGLIFGFVSEIFKANRYFEKAESVAEFELTSSVREHFPSDGWEYLSGRVKVLGTFRGGKFERLFVPPSPGLEVVEADAEKLVKFLGFEQEGLHLGNIEHHPVEAKVSLTRLLQKHFAILAMSGAGKSHLSSVILEELLSRKKEQGRVAIIVIDIHGEYVGFGFDPIFGKQTQIIDGNEITVPMKKISPETIMEWLPDLSPAQRDLLRNSIHELKEKNKDGEGFKFTELMARIEIHDQDDKTKRALKRSLMEIKRYRFLSKKKEYPKLISDIAPGKLTILDFSTIDSQRKKQILVTMLARRLFNLRKKGKIPPFLLLIEEAHNFAKEKAEEREAVSRNVIETIAREGRKFGASLGLISQRPVNLSTTALSQCNTHIILRVTNPNDIDHIQKSAEGIDARVAGSITSLKVGEAIIIGEAVNYPIFIRVRERKSEKRERGKALHLQAIEFEEKKEKKEKGVDAFV